MKDTYRQRVISMFPDAVLFKMVRYFIKNENDNILGAGFTAEDAWKNAYLKYTSK